MDVKPSEDGEGWNVQLLEKAEDGTWKPLTPSEPDGVAKQWLTLALNNVHKKKDDHVGRMDFRRFPLPPPNQNVVPDDESIWHLAEVAALMEKTRAEMRDAAAAANPRLTRGTMAADPRPTSSRELVETLDAQLGSAAAAQALNPEFSVTDTIPSYVHINAKVAPQLYARAKLPRAWEDLLNLAQLSPPAFMELHNKALAIDSRHEKTKNETATLLVDMTPEERAECIADKTRNGPWIATQQRFRRYIEWLLRTLSGHFNLQLADFLLPLPKPERGAE